MVLMTRHVPHQTKEKVMVAIEFKFSENCTSEEQQELQEVFIRLLEIDRNWYAIGAKFILPRNINKTMTITDISIKN
jgi:hypothetical protein